MRIRMAKRILWLSVVNLALLGSLGYRLYDLQILRERAMTQQVYQQRTQTLPLQMRRGRILDRNGVPLTDPESAYGLAVFPRLLGDRAQLREVLSGVLADPGQVEQILRHAEQSSDPAWVLTALSRGEAERIAAAGLPGLAVGPAGRRYGPDSLARHLVGYANDAGGQSGLEKAFDQELFGSNVPHLVATFDGRGRPLFSDPIRVMQPDDPAGKEPYDLFTTLDARIQRVVEREMDRAAQPGGGPLRAAVVVLDVSTGDLLAMASRPDFSQERMPESDRYAPLVNRALAAYEPGSVFKVVVAAMALEQGAVSLDEEFECSGHYELGGLTFKDYDGKSHGRLTFRDAIAQSCNLTFIEVGYERLGGESLLAAARLFGFGQPTGILPGQESAGLLPRLTFDGDIAQFSFGQAGLMVTPVQVARAYAAIANGGVLNPVRLVTAVKKPSGVVVERPELAMRKRIMTRETAAELQEALLAVTDPEGRGTGRGAWLEPGGAAGKTGSAEAAGGVTHAWFSGWVPARHPKYVITVLIENGQAGGTYAAPLFRRIAEGIERL